MQKQLFFSSSFFVILLLVLPGCWGKKSTVGVQEPGEKTEKLYVINVLSQKLYDECHIKGSISVPFETVTDWAKAVDKNSAVVVYCANYACSASGMAAKELIDLGFASVWAYEAGMHDWYKNKLPTECKTESKYLKGDNESFESEHAVPVIGTDALYEKMKLYGFFKN